MASGEKSIGGYIRDISKEVRDERMSQERQNDAAERVIDNPRAFIIHCDRILRLHCIGADQIPTMKEFRATMKKVSVLAQSAMLLIDLHRDE